MSAELISRTALFLSLIPIIQLLYTVLFSILQAKHNKKSLDLQREYNENSLKPLCSIIQCNYRDEIFIKIHNGGMGSLTITNFKCYRGELEETDTLFSLLSKISQKNYFITLRAKGRVIQVGGELTIFRIKPDNENTTNEVRHILNGIIIEIEYEDVYKIKYSKRQKLDYFDIWNVDIASQGL